VLHISKSLFRRDFEDKLKREEERLELVARQMRAVAEAMAREEARREEARRQMAREAKERAAYWREFEKQNKRK